jgi:tetrahydromethanopterin S-methyltransferase subunit B
MKITINVDCSPEEARAFMGLPDVRPMQEAMMGQMTQRMEQAMKAMDPETLLRQWFGGAGIAEMQKFWTNMAGMGGEKK